MNFSRRGFLRRIATMAPALAVLPHRFVRAEQARVTVYLGPGCDCCRRWLDHMVANGFRAEGVQHDDLSVLKRRLGVPPDLASCHTAVIGGYVIEGHVPAADVTRLLLERPRGAKGLAVPGMVAGSPGMEGARREAYATLVFDGYGSRVFARH